MLSWLANAWRVPELRRRVLFTGMILALYRLGSWMPAPGIDAQSIKDYFNSQGGTVLGLLNLFSGDQFGKTHSFRQSGGPTRGTAWIESPSKQRTRSHYGCPSYYS